MIRYRARWVVPISSPPIADGIVAVDGDRIVYVGASTNESGDELEDLGDVLLLPGLVNAHCHLELTAMRGFLEDLEFHRWILRLTRARRAVLDDDALLDSARYGLEEGVRAGITAYADTCQSGVAIRAMRDAGVRGVMFQEVFGPDPAQFATSIAELRERVAGLRYLETPLVRLGISPHAPYTVSDELFRGATALAREQRLPMAIHIAESEAERQLVVEGGGAFASALRQRGFRVAPRARSAISLLSTLGVLDVAPLLIHCVHIDERDIEAIAASHSSVAHCPASNAKLGHGVAPLAELLHAGVTVGLGSDSMASNNRMNILEEARLALLTQRARLRTSERPDAASVLELATIGGARAIGIDELVGSLAVGKQADLAAFALDAHAPTQDPVAAAVYSITATQARFVSVAGRPLVRNGTLVSHRPALAARVQALGDALADWLASGGEMRGAR